MAVSAGIGCMMLHPHIRQVPIFGNKLTSSRLKLIRGWTPEDTALICRERVTKEESKVVRLAAGSIVIAIPEPQKIWCLPVMTKMPTRGYVQILCP